MAISRICALLVRSTPPLLLRFPRSPASSTAAAIVATRISTNGKTWCSIHYGTPVRYLADLVQRHRVAIMVYGLINFESYFRGREIAERLRSQDPSRYPHLESTYKYFRSFRPAYRCNLIRLARMVNEELREMVTELNRGLGDNTKVDAIPFPMSRLLGDADIDVATFHLQPNKAVRADRQHGVHDPRQRRAGWRLGRR